MENPPWKTLLGTFYEKELQGAAHGVVGNDWFKGPHHANKSLFVFIVCSITAGRKGLRKSLAAITSMTKQRRVALMINLERPYHYNLEVYAGS
ncbi:MAG: hypothetical protein ACKVLL_10125 [Verrucomicrobiales bacterium]